LASGAGAVVTGATGLRTRHGCGARLAADGRAPAVVDCDHSFTGQLFECASQRTDGQPMLGGQLAYRRELVTWCQLT
jgi:hypothetical protein